MLIERTFGSYRVVRMLGAGGVAPGLAGLGVGLDRANQVGARTMSRWR